MRLLFLNNREQLPFNFVNIVNEVQALFSGGETPNCKFIDLTKVDFKSLQIGESDVVFLAFAEVHKNPIDRSLLSTQINYLKQRSAEIVLCTELNCVSNKERYLGKSADDIIIYQLAKEHNLKVLDLASFSTSWYLRQTNEDRNRLSETIPYDSNDYGVNSVTINNDFAKYVANWLYKQVHDEPLFHDYYYGASMYPEVWDRDTIIHDIKRMKQIGMNVVRIGEFFWDKLEPQPGKYNMKYLRALLSLYRENSIKVILGIPSPTPPRWFTVKYPNSKITNSDGVHEEHGSRQHVCTNYPVFRQKVCQLTYQIAHTAKQFNNVIAFQIDNEFKCHVDLCFCETCRKMWPKWLQIHYQTIDNLNKKWGTDIWSERYDSFDDVVLPTKTPFTHNSALMNAFRMFTADTINDLAGYMGQIITAETTIPVTHNTALGFNLQNNDLFNQLDVVGFDTYAESKQYWGFTMNLDLWRNLLPRNEYLLLETTTSHVGYIGRYVAPHPKGYLQTEIFLGFASGLKSFIYWPFRAHAIGVEQTHSAVVTQVGSPDLGYEDVVKGGKMLSQLQPFLTNSTIVRSKIGIVYSDNSKRYYNIETGGIYNYRTIITKFYHSLTSRGLSVDLIQEDTDYSKYKCVLVPFVRHISKSMFNKLKVFADQGGKLILGPMTADRTVDLTWETNDNELGTVGQWLEITDVIQYLSEDPRTRVNVRFSGNEEPLGGLVTCFKTTKPDNDFEITSDVIAGRTVIAKDDNVLYLGALPNDLESSQFWDKFVRKEIKPFDADHEYLDVENGMMKYRRESTDEIQFYLANMSGDSSVIHLHQTALDMNDKKYDVGDYTIDKYGCLMLKIKK